MKNKNKRLYNKIIIIFFEEFYKNDNKFYFTDIGKLRLLIKHYLTQTVNCNVHKHAREWLVE